MIASYWRDMLRNLLKSFRLRFLLFLLIVIFPQWVAAQGIVNIEDMRREGEIGAFSSLSLALSGLRGNDKRDNYTIQARFDKNTVDIDSFFIAQKSKMKRNDMVMADSSMLHGRVVFKNDSKYDPEIFVQQTKDPFLRYHQRDILGAGARITLNDHARMGLGLLTENEEDMNAIKTRTERITSYFHDDYEVAENINFNVTIYYQPSIDSTKDYKASLLGSFDFKINDNFKISFVYNTFFDSMPPVTAIKRDEALATKLTYYFQK